MQNATKQFYTLVLLLFFCVDTWAQPGLLIHRAMPNAASNREVIELIATKAINFAVTPYTVIAADGAVATNGWLSGKPLGAASYAFEINAGTATAGQYVYVGGSLTGIVSCGASKFVDVSTTDGAAGIGKKNAIGAGNVMPNGGSNASGIGVFDVAAASITTATIPVDALFYGSALGNAGLTKFTVPVNDIYAGRNYAWPDNLYLAPNPTASGNYIAPQATCQFFPSLNRWGIGRKFIGNNISVANCGLAPLIAFNNNLQVSSSLATINPYINYQPVTNYLFSNGIAAANVVSQVNYEGVSAVMNDPTDPALVTSGVVFTVKIAGIDVPLASYSITATSSNTTLVPNNVLNLIITKANGLATLKINPVSAAIGGYSNITVTITSGVFTETRIIRYAASPLYPPPPIITPSYWHTGTCDASGAVPQDDNNMIVIDDENDRLYVYSRYQSGLPLTVFDFNKDNVLGFLPANYDNGGANAGKYKETDVEGIARSPITSSKLYIIGSMGNDNSNALAPDRDRLIGLTTSGIGAATTFANNGYTTLRSNVVAWGDSYGYDFTNSAKSGIDPKTINGFNIEGLTFAPDGTSLWIGFRAPLLPITNRKKAVLCPVLNFETWFNNGTPIGAPSFGPPIELDLTYSPLGTVIPRGIRDIIHRSYNNEYIIIAGDVGGNANGALFRWTGNAADPPIYIEDLSGQNLNVEGVLEMSSGGTIYGDRVQLINDHGSNYVLYNDGNDTKDLVYSNYKKFRSDVILKITLPQHFTGFTAKPTGSLVNLQWTMAENNFAGYFEIQYASDGKNFSTIGRLSGNYNNRYTFTAEQPTEYDKHFYRIRAVQNTGEPFYSSVKTIVFRTQASIIVSPTFIRNEDLTIRCTETGTKAVKIVGSNGSVFKQFSFNNNQVSLSTENWPAGIYMIQIRTSGGKIKTEKLVISQ
jgi:Secretion system C-terminal sorting domain